MNEVYFACRVCKTYHDAGYGWCYWKLEATGIVRRGRPLDLREVWNAGEYRYAPDDAAWLRELLPKVRAFLKRHEKHELTYGDGEDIGLVPLSDEDYRFLDWMDESEDPWLAPPDFPLVANTGIICSSHIQREETHMPIYEYWCSRCRALFDKLRPIAGDDAEVKCPRCGSNVKRMLSVIAAVTKTGAEGYSTPANGGGCACGGGACGCGRH